MNLDSKTIISVLAVVMLVLNIYRHKKNNQIEEFSNENSETENVLEQAQEILEQSGLPVSETRIAKHENPAAHINQRIIRKQIVMQFKSWERNINKYPLANQYTVDFTSPMYNVESIELLRAAIPKGEYIVNDTNKFMEVYDVVTNTVVEAEISTGNYNILQYCQKLTSLFSATIIPLVFTFNPAPSPPTTTDILITATKEFHILNGTGFRKNQSNFPDLGLTAQDLISKLNLETGAHEIRGHRCDILGSRYVDLDIMELSEWSANSFQPNNTLASIALNASTPVTNFEPSSTGPKRIFNPHAVISKISFAFYDNTPYKPRRPYNFNGLEHSMTLAFTVLSYEGSIPPLSNTI